MVASNASTANQMVNHLVNHLVKCVQPALKHLSSWNECFSLLLCYFKHYIECLLWIENVSLGNIMKSFSTILAVIWNWEKSIKKSREKMATSFFGKFTPSRTQCNQRPKINIRNLRENIGPSTISNEVENGDKQTETNTSRLKVNTAVQRDRFICSRHRHTTRLLVNQVDFESHLNDVTISLIDTCI